MPPAPLALVASRAQAAQALAVAARVPVAGLWPAAAARACGLPALPALSGVPSVAAACCFLAPTPGLQARVLELLRSGVHVLCAGPPAAAAGLEALRSEARGHGARLAWGGLYAGTPLVRELGRQRRKPAFGAPVHLRLLLGCAAGTVGAWWALCQALEIAASVLEDPARAAHVTAIGRGRRCQATLTVRTVGRTLVQLVAAPFAPSPGPEVSLLGTGGLVSGAAALGSPLLAGPPHAAVLPHLEELAVAGWVERFVDAPAGTAPAQADGWVAALQESARPALGEALRRRAPVGLHVG